MKRVLLRLPWQHDEANNERVRAAFSAILMPWVGLGPKGSGERLEAYATILYPHDDRNKAIAFAKVHSTCALTSLAAAEALGAVTSFTGDPYARHQGEAVSMIVALCRRLGTVVEPWRDPKAPPPPPGSIVLIGGVNGEQEHLTNVVTRADGMGPDDALLCVDGGQPDVDGPDDDNEPDGGIQAIVRRFAPSAPGGKMRAWKRDPRTGNFSVGRHVALYCDVTTLALRAEATVPDEFPDW